jgi:hypothetical protein
MQRFKPSPDGPPTRPFTTMEISITNLNKAGSLSTSASERCFMFQKLQCHGCVLSCLCSGSSSKTGQRLVNVLNATVKLLDPLATIGAAVKVIKGRFPTIALSCRPLCSNDFKSQVVPIKSIICNSSMYYESGINCRKSKLKVPNSFPTCSQLVPTPY